MKFTAAAVLSAAAGVSATYSGYPVGNGTVTPTGSVAPTGTGGVTYVTEVVTAITTYCPEATKITHGGKTYVVTSATTLTITDCPCTVVKPVIPTHAVVCNTCGYNNNTVPATHSAVGPAPGPSYAAPAGSHAAPAGSQPAAAPSKAAPGVSKAAPTGSNTPTVPTAGAGRAVALTGAGLAGVVGLAAFLL